MPRVAYFPDSFHEVNGVAHTSRHFEAFARRRNLPFLCVRAGDRGQAWSPKTAMCGRWSCRAAFSPLPWKKTCASIRRFCATSPLIGEVLERFQARPDSHHRAERGGDAGRGLAHHLGLPLAASWHTNVHEYLARRSEWFLRLLPKSANCGDRAEDRRPGDGRGGAVLLAWRRCCLRPTRNFARCWSGPRAGPAT
jgi:phosphatidylinositol alpha 1,6-mannosyltransferase